MPIERTLSIIKPDAVFAGHTEGILEMIKAAGLSVVHSSFNHLSREEAKNFYAEHDGKEFQQRLIDFMVSGPIFVSVLEGENAISAYRELMGATKPEDRKLGTIRQVYGDPSITMRNAVHGSDSPVSAEREITIMFNGLVSPRPESRKSPRP